MRYSSVIFVLVLFKCCLLGVNAGCPNIVSRSEWGARDPTGWTNMATPVDNFIIHHTEGSHCIDQASCSSVVRGIQNYHMDSNGWWDIGYNFLIGEDGNVYEGRGWDTVGAHAGVTEYNQNGLGVSMMGDFTWKIPLPVAQEALCDLLDCAIAMGKLNSEHNILGHRDVTSTLCPGTYFYENFVDPLWNKDCSSQITYNDRVECPE